MKTEQQVVYSKRGVDSEVSKKSQDGYWLEEIKQMSDGYFVLIFKRYVVE